MADRGHQAVHTALAEMLDDGEIALRWTLVIDIAGPDGMRYLAHRAGGGHDGTDAPMVWEVVGLLQLGLDAARAQGREVTHDADDDEDADG